MGNASSPPSSPFESTGVISFDTLRYLAMTESSQEYRRPNLGKRFPTPDAWEAVSKLALAEREHLSKLIREAEYHQRNLPNVNPKAFATSFSRIIERMEMALREEILNVYVATDQVVHADSFRKKVWSFKTIFRVRGDPDFIVTHLNIFLDRMRLYLAWLRELANMTLEYTNINTIDRYDSLNLFRLSFADANIVKRQLMDRALKSLSPVPCVEALTEWMATPEKRV